MAALAGDAAVLRFGLLDLGYHAPTPDEVAATAAAASLDRLSPLGRERLLEAEAEEADPERADGSVSWRSATSLADWGDGMEAAAHLRYLGIVADGFVNRHAWAIRKVAQALLERETLDGATAAQLVQWTRCVCHGYTPPPDKEAAMPKLSEPKPEPAVASDGYPIVRYLTLDHPHAMVATGSFWVPFVSLPFGYVSAGLTWVTAGQLGDDRSALVRESRQHWRKPTGDEVAAAKGPAD